MASVKKRRRKEWRKVMNDPYATFMPPFTFEFNTCKIIYTHPIHWRRVLFTTYLHEFTHFLQWVFICRCNHSRWAELCTQEERIEKWPRRVKLIVLSILCMKTMVYEED